MKKSKGFNLFGIGESFDPTKCQLINLKEVIEAMKPKRKKSKKKS